MKRPESIRGQVGFTLIESMIAMFFLAFMVGDLGVVFVYASRNTNLSQRITRANQLADEAIEKSRNADYEKLQDPIGLLGETGAAGATHTTSHDNGRFTRVRTVTPYDKDFDTGGNTVIPLADSNRAVVDVVVTFVDARGTSQTIRVAAVVSRYY